MGHVRINAGLENAGGVAGLGNSAELNYLI